MYNTNTVGTKVLVNNICTVVSQLLAEVCEVNKLNKEEDVNNSSFSLSCSENLSLEKPNRSYKLKKTKAAFPKLRELRLENPKNIVISYLNINNIGNKFT